MSLRAAGNGPPITARCPPVSSPSSLDDIESSVGSGLTSAGTYSEVGSVTSISLANSGIYGICSEITITSHGAPSSPSLLKGEEQLYSLIIPRITAS